MTELATVISIQTRLSELTIHEGELDGKMGKITRTSIRAFQRIHGLTQDGVVGPLTFAELFPAPIPDRLEIKPAPKVVGNPWPGQSDCLKFYGPVGQNQVMIDLPYPMWLAWDLGKQIKRVSVHKKVAASCQRILTRVKDHYGLKEIDRLDLDVWGGTLNVRKMRGGTSWSMHSWGIAWDFDPINNQLKWTKDKARMAKPEYLPFWRIWEDEGWISLGRAKGYDWMHVQAARI